MQDQKYVLAMDCGTQSIRGLVFDRNGTLLESEKVVFDPPYFSINPDWAEREAYLYWEDFCAVTQKLIKKNSRLMSEISAVTLTTQRDTCILVDKKGVELRPAILWMDQRKIREPRKLNFIYENGTKVIGMKKTINNFSRGCHAHWLQDHEKDHWEKSYKFILISTYLIHRLTGNFADSVSAQTGHMPLNY
ncbi:MAG: carbohydrate kinase, partial [Eubacteriaceae bacterium]|nr:carbohydrate kinase [Eubacteriaceae bacterium]